jgi:hypothetical protein
MKTHPNCSLLRIRLSMIAFLVAVLALECSCLLPKSLVIKRRMRESPTSHQWNIRNRQCSRSTIEMRDRSSSYWFQVGDTVRVVSSDIEKGGVNLQNRVGKVIETWEKCDVDPTCCCAEQVDPNMAVRVEFEGSLSEDHEATSSSFNHYFAESELEKQVDDNASSQSIPFDGQSCVAFKLDHLKMGQQAQRLAVFESSRDDSNNASILE